MKVQWICVLSTTNQLKTEFWFIYRHLLFIYRIVLLMQLLFFDSENMHFFVIKVSYHYNELAMSLHEKIWTDSTTAFNIKKIRMLRKRRLYRSGVELDSYIRYSGKKSGIKGIEGSIQLTVFCFRGIHVLCECAWIAFLQNTTAEI